LSALFLEQLGKRVPIYTKFGKDIDQSSLVSKYVSRRIRCSFYKGGQHKKD